MLEIKNLKVNVENTEILKGVNLTVLPNKIHALMGPNGSGKSTLAQTLMGHPAYKVTAGQALFNGQDLFEMEPNERAVKGVFLSFQYPSEIAGVGVLSFLRMVHNNKRAYWGTSEASGHNKRVYWGTSEASGHKRHAQNMPPVQFKKLLQEKMEILGMKEEYLSRYLNEGFSGGEKKRMEMLQMLVLEPKLAILDETDSGLDVDALKYVAKAVNYLKEKNGMSVLIITHYARILDYIRPDAVQVMQNGVIVRAGDYALAQEIERKGYGTGESNKTD